MPVLSGVRLEVRGDRLLVAGSDLDLTIQVDVVCTTRRSVRCRAHGPSRYRAPDMCVPDL